MPLPDSRRETEELLAEAKYYLVQGLADECTAALQVTITTDRCHKELLVSNLQSSLGPIKLSIMQVNLVS